MNKGRVHALPAVTLALAGRAAMATIPPAGSRREHCVVVPIDSTADDDDADAAGDQTLQREQRAAGVVQRSESSSSSKPRWRKWALGTLNEAAYWVVWLEWAGNAVGTLGMLWATVILLGGFRSQLTNKDLWFSTVMIFVEATRVFIRGDAVTKWLFGSTSAFRCQGFSFCPMVASLRGNLIALAIGMCISFVSTFPPDIVISIIKVALLVIISQILSRMSNCPVGRHLLKIFPIAAIVGAMETAAKQRPQRVTMGLKSSGKTTFGSVLAWEVGTMLLMNLAAEISKLQCLQQDGALMTIKLITASVLACFPFLQSTLASYYTYVSISVAAVLATLISPLKPFAERRLSFQIIGTIMPILVFWSVMFPLPGISLEVSFFMLFTATALVLVGNLQIPMAFLQILLPALRLRSLLGHHHHDYGGTSPSSPNLVPSILVFFMLELCQGSCYIIASFLGLLPIVLGELIACRALGLKQDWGPRAVKLYVHQAYQAHKEKGPLSSETQEKTPSLDSFAIKSLLGRASSDEMQIVGLQILDSSLEGGDAKSSEKLIIEIVKDAESIITAIIGLISYLTDEEDISIGLIRYLGDKMKMLEKIIKRLYLTGEENSSGTHHHKVVRSFCYNFAMLLISGESGKDDTQQEKKAEQKEAVRLSLKLVRRLLAISGGKTSAMFRQELLKKPFFLDSLHHILSLEKCRVELWEPVMDTIAILALDEAARKEIGSTKSIVHKLMHAFLVPSKNSDPSDGEKKNKDCPLRMAAGKALANLTMMSTICTDNCCDILLSDSEHYLIKNLIDLLDDDYYTYVAANLLHNLCANSRGNLMDINILTNGLLESALLPKVMQIIRTEEGKQLEAALYVASQIGYVVPEYFAGMLESDTDAAAGELVGKLVDTLKSKEPCLDCPWIRRFLVEVVISIAEKCPRYIEFFIQKEAKNALDLVKRTPSRLEKYRVFHDGKGVVTESLPMRDLVDKAKRLIDLATPTPLCLDIHRLRGDGRD